VEKAVAVPGVGAVDKAAIARQLANALVAQGKTDVTQAELEQLINAVVSTLLLLESGFLGILLFVNNKKKQPTFDLI